jgi:hypothetical protein
MSGVPKIEIAESVEELKSLMKQQKTGLGYAKIQSLYLLKIKAVETVNHLAVIIGRGESTIHRWLQLYKLGGLASLLQEPPKTGRPKKLEIETREKPVEQLGNWVKTSQPNVQVDETPWSVKGIKEWFSITIALFKPIAIAMPISIGQHALKPS